MAIFFDKDRDLLTEYLAHKDTINCPSYALFIDWLRLVILEKCCTKVKNRVLLFMKMHSFTSRMLCRLSFTAQTSSNRITLPILQVLHCLTTACFHIRRNSFVARVLASMTKRQRLSRVTSMTLIQSFFLQVYRVSLVSGSVWLLLKVDTFNICSNYYPAV